MRRYCCSNLIKICGKFYALRERRWKINAQPRVNKDCSTVALNLKSVTIVETEFSFRASFTPNGLFPWNKIQSVTSWTEESEALDVMWIVSNFEGRRSCTCEHKYFEFYLFHVRTLIVLVFSIPTTALITFKYAINVEKARSSLKTDEIQGRNM